MGSKQVQNVVVQATVISLRFCDKCGALVFAIKAQVDGWLNFHGREGSTIRGWYQFVKF